MPIDPHCVIAPPLDPHCVPSDCPLITADELVWQVKRAKSAALQNLFEGDSFNETSQVVLGAEVAMAAELAGAALAEAQAIDARCESFEGVWLDDQVEGVDVGASDGPVASSSAAQSPITTPITTTCHPPSLSISI